jgi:hypothetical protein
MTIGRQVRGLIKISRASAIVRSLAEVNNEVPAATGLPASKLRVNLSRGERIGGNPQRCLKADKKQH